MRSGPKGTQHPYPAARAAQRIASQRSASRRVASFAVREAPGEKHTRRYTNAAHCGQLWVRHTLQLPPLP